MKPQKTGGIDYNLGLDIGIGSVGFAVIKIDNKGEPQQLLAANSHIFETGEHPKDGSSLALPRRLSRGQRRRGLRRTIRQKKIIALLQQHGILFDPNIIAPKSIVAKRDQHQPTTPAPAGDAVGNNSESNPWFLRHAALTRPLNGTEMARVLYHIAKHRGFQSNRKTPLTAEQREQLIEETKKTNAEEAGALEGMAELQKQWSFDKNSYPTIGSYLAQLTTGGAFYEQGKSPRNKDGTYSKTVTRDDLRAEIDIIFEKQLALGNKDCSDKLRDAYKQIAFTQKPVAEGDQIDKMVGLCQFYGKGNPYDQEPQKRAPKHAPTAELFLLQTKLNNLRILSKGKEISLTTSQKSAIADEVWRKKSGANFGDLRKALQSTGVMEGSDIFNLCHYGDNTNKGKGKKQPTKEKTKEKTKEEAEKTIFFEAKGYHGLKSIFTNRGEQWFRDHYHGDRIFLNDVARVLTIYKDEDNLHNELSRLGLDKAEITIALDVAFSKFMDISIMAVDKILPHMQAGQRYDEAVLSAGFNDHRAYRGGKKKTKLPPIDAESIRNPTVVRSLSMVRKIINAVIAKYGMPTNIIIETTRELAKSKKERDEITKNQNANRQERLEAKEEFEETFGREARGDDILKYRLYQEQDCLCPYSGEPIKPKDLKDPNALQIDHIIPYARSWNDSQANKILTFTKYNQEKGDNTPYEKWGATERWETIEALAENLPPKKKHNVLIKEFDEDDFKSRHLVNTGYIARALLAHVEKHLDLPPIIINGQEKKQRVQSRNGQLTAKLRGLWGVNNIYKPDAASQGDDNNDAKEKEKGATKKERSHDRHHIVDAIVIACSTQSMVQAASNWNRHNARMLRQEKEKARKSATGEVRMDFYAKAPWPNFRDDVKKFINSPDLFISRQPVRTITGEGHEATVKSLRTDADGNRLKSVKKLSLTRADKNTITGWKKSFANNDDKNPFNNMVDEVEQQKRYENKQSKQRHSKIYLAIKDRLEKTPDEELKNAFEKPLYLPSAPGRVAPIIRSVRIYDNSVSGIAVRGGIADNGAHARLDIFGMVETKGKNKGNMQFYLVPCFNHQVNRRDAAGNPTLPDEYLPYKNGRGEKLTPNHQFLFSLFKGDLVKIKRKEDKEPLFLYYNNCDISANRIVLTIHDRDQTITKYQGQTAKNGTIRIAPQKSEIFEKWVVDYFGHKHRIKTNPPRQPLTRRYKNRRYKKRATA